jgi:DNA-binding MarR family transcriptional regulator
MADTPDIDAERVYLLVQHLARRLGEVNVAFDLTSARFAVLANLKFHGAYNVGALAAALQVSRPAMTRLVRDMEVAGLVERSPDERDGRGVRVAITREGARVLDSVRRAKIALVAGGLADLTENERAAVGLALEHLESLTTTQAVSTGSDGGGAGD